jgi:hypothetical protein
MTKTKKEYIRLVSIVKNRRIKEGLPARHEDIANVLGYDRAYFSTLLGSRSNVNQDHIKLLKLHFPFLEEKTIERTDREILLSIEKMLITLTKRK